MHFPINILNQPGCKFLAGLVIVLAGAVPGWAQESASGAAQMAENSRTLWDMVSAGGPLVIPILLCSFVLCVVVFERTLSLRRVRVVPRVFIERFIIKISEGAIDKTKALERC